MAGVVDNAMLSAPLAAFAARKLFSRKTRKGGGPKGNLWRAQQEEAKEKLLETLISQGLTKPTAQNVTKYAAAKRQGEDQAEEVLQGIITRKEDEKAVKNAAKATRKKERNAAKALKKAERAAEKAAEKAAVKATETRWAAISAPNAHCL